MQKEFKNLENNLKIAANTLLDMEIPKKELKEKIDELQKSLIKEFIKINHNEKETEKINTTQVISFKLNK